MEKQKYLFDQLKELNINFQIYEHLPVFTVQEAMKLAKNIPGGQIKNLFLKDSKNKFWLIVAESNTKIELKKVSKIIQAKELRFASPELLDKYLGVLPGSVSPLALINDYDHDVTVILDNKLTDFDIIGLHPLKNDKTITISPCDLKKFINYNKNKMIIFDFIILKEQN